MGYLYAKVSREIALTLGFANIRQRVSDGDYILNQSDVMALDGDTLEEKVEAAGGILLTEYEAKEELKNKYVEHQTEEEEEYE